MEKLFAEVAKVPGVTAVVSPYSTDGARQVARSGDIAYATVQFARQASKIPDATIEYIHRPTEAWLHSTICAKRRKALNS